jgi:hypothetical protein
LSDYTFDKVSKWFDTDGFIMFVQTVRSGDIVELRSTKSSHWGIAVRVKQPPKSPRSKSKQRKSRKPMKKSLSYVDFSRALKFFL